MLVKIYFLIILIIFLINFFYKTNLKSKFTFNFIFFLNIKKSFELIIILFKRINKLLINKFTYFYYFQ